jgi:hypothetical protein
LLFRYFLKSSTALLNISIKIPAPPANKAEDAWFMVWNSFSSEIQAIKNKILVSIKMTDTNNPRNCDGRRMSIVKIQKTGTKNQKSSSFRFRNRIKVHHSNSTKLYLINDLFMILFQSINVFLRVNIVRYKKKSSPEGKIFLHFKKQH